MLSRVPNIIKIRFGLKQRQKYHILNINMIFSVFPTFLDLVAQRGERLELLIDKTENLVDSVSTGNDDIFQDIK